MHLRQFALRNSCSRELDFPTSPESSRLTREVLSVWVADGDAARQTRRTAFGRVWRCVTFVRTVAETLACGCSKAFRLARRALARGAAVAALISLVLSAPDAHGADTIKVGILSSLSGVMAAAETDLKNTALMTIAAINAHGGVLGRQIEPLVVDPASDWPLSSASRSGWS